MIELTLLNNAEEYIYYRTDTTHEMRLHLLWPLRIATP